MALGEGIDLGSPEHQVRRAELMNQIDELLRRLAHLREMHGQVDTWLMAGEMHWFYSTCEKLIDIYTKEQRLVAQQLDEVVAKLKAEEESERRL